MHPVTTPEQDPLAAYLAASAITTRPAKSRPNRAPAFRPLLARHVIPGERFGGAMLSSPKLDGARCLVIGGVPHTRSLAPFPNRRLRELFDWRALDGLDGELIIGAPAAPEAFYITSGALMSHDAPLDGLTFYVFDHFGTPSQPYAKRIKTASGQVAAARISSAVMIEQTPVASADEIARAEEAAIACGYEGLILRSAAGTYKHGRTAASGAEFLKLKRFADGEAEIVGTLPYKSSDGVQPLLGAIQARDTATGAMFDIGTGFTMRTRDELWAVRDALPGQLVRYRHQPAGAKSAPRFPVFAGLRSRIDL